MIPLKLQLENFMSYGKGVPPLPLNDMRLACLSGDNGNGKSAILDAITWVLFGETRAPREDDVIRLGAPSCRVMLDFQLGEAKYRIIKQRDRKGTSPVWTLQAWQDDDTLRNISDGRETKAKLEGLLRLNYEMFLATAYLAQGRADVFARAKASERKQIVADILDLSRYDELEKRARETQREAKERRSAAESQLTQIDFELQDKDRIDAELESAELLLADAAAQLSQLQATRDTAHTQFEQCQGYANSAKEWDDKLRELEQDEAVALREADSLRRRIANAEAILSRRPEIEKQEREATALEQRIQSLQSQVEEATALYREREQLTESVQRAHTELDRELYRLTREVQDLEQETKELERYDAERATSEAEIAAYGDPEARRKAAEAERGYAEDAFTELKAQRNSAKAEQERLEKRLAALTGSDASQCEFCGQPLTLKARQAAIAETEAALETNGEQQSLLAAQGREAKKLAEEWKAASEQALTDSRLVAQLVNRSAHAHQEALRLRERIAQLPNREKQRQTLAEQLDSGEFSRQEKERLMVLAAQLEKIERFNEELRSLRQQWSSHRELPTERARLTQAEGILVEEPPRLTELEARALSLSTKIEKGRPRVDEMRQRAANLPLLHQVLTDSENALRRQNADMHQAHSRIGGLKTEQDRLKVREKERTRTEADRVAAARDELLYAELTAAFGKKGVQALIIENALPEIQEETNRLLGRMTNGAMRVAFETHREARTKSASPIETLDIIIEDDLGTRAYEMYSGGEAFRVNLALRVALSKMLARRAGAPLQTLILDEGFGTQDPRGREAIAEALEAISEEFALILVITHVEELKDRFPTRIEISKGPEGSRFTLN
ncbi:SMC family ATPase [Armatimonas sp.]|uniref:SMC family ATPase n=1 Tax=Armatimonas sp. TaxID=1872638 RepID=UPI00286C8C0E|nr:SMC family ATPase [Armatimonas sp.]